MELQFNVTSFNAEGFMRDFMLGDELLFRCLSDDDLETDEPKGRVHFFIDAPISNDETFVCFDIGLEDAKNLIIKLQSIIDNTK